MLPSIRSRLAARLLLTQCMTTGALFGAGDLLAQHGFENRSFESGDYTRTARLGVYGAVVFAPIASKWFHFLQNNIVLKIPIQTLCARVAMDQILFAPIAISMFLGVTSAMEGKDPILQVDENLVPTYKMNLMVWPWVQFANFTLIPLHYRLLFVNTVNIGWSGVLSSMNSTGSS